MRQENENIYIVIKTSFLRPVDSENTVVGRKIIYISSNCTFFQKTDNLITARDELTECPSVRLSANF